MDNIYELIRKSESDYITGETILGKYVSFSQFENVEKIDAYINSKHISGETDSMNRPKPFFNIVTAAVNIWYRATDLDRKDIRIKATKRIQYVLAFLASIHLQNWMKKTLFGVFLNDWGRALSKYGSAVSKFVEKDGILYASVIPWNRLISDTVDFENNPKIEVLFLTPSQLKKNKSYDQKMVKALLDSLQARETQDKRKKDNKSDYIKLYEIHGELPLSYLTDKEADEDIYQQQMQVVSFVQKRNKGKNEYEDFTLYKGKESQDPYDIDHLIKEDGRSQSIGAVESLFESQWMVNHSVKSIKDQLDLASKLIFQTADANFVGRNVLSAIENGDILVHKDNSPLTQVANNSHDITSLQNFATQWMALGRDVTSTPEAARGITPPSGIAMGTVQLVTAQGLSLFEIMLENKGLGLERKLRERIIPNLKKKMDTTEEISATLDSVGITQLDSMYVPNEAIRINNKVIKADILSGKVAENLDMNALQNSIQEGLNANGSQRFIKPSDIPTKTWKEVFKDFEFEVEVDITGENQDKQAVLQTLNMILQTIASNPAVLQDPNARMIFNKILEEVGNISPIELSQFKQPTPQQPVIGGVDTVQSVAQK